MLNNLFNKILGLKQNASHKFHLGRKLLHSFNNSLGVKLIRGAGSYLDSYPMLEQTLNKIPYVGKYIPTGIKMANQGLDKAQQLEDYADKFANYTGFGVSDSGGTIRPDNV